MVINEFWVVLLDVNSRENYIPEEKRQNLAERNSESYDNQKECIEEFLDNKGAFYKGSKRDFGDNYDEKI